MRLFRNPFFSQLLSVFDGNGLLVASGRENGVLIRIAPEEC